MSSVSQSYAECEVTCVALFCLFALWLLVRHAAASVCVSNRGSDWPYLYNRHTEQ